MNERRGDWRKELVEGEKLEGRNDKHRWTMTKGAVRQSTLLSIFKILSIVVRKGPPRRSIHIYINCQYNVASLK